MFTMSNNTTSPNTIINSTSMDDDKKKTADIQQQQPPPHEEEEIDCGTTYIETEHYQEYRSKQDDAEDGIDDETKRRLVLPTMYKDDDYDDQQQQPQRDESMTIDILRDSLASDVIIGGNGPYTMFTSPFETKKGSQQQHAHHHNESSSNKKYYTVPLIYCDQTASNRPLQSIERYIETTCVPLYGNTHTNTSITGSQSTAFVAEARQIVAETTNAKITGKAALDIVLFTGHGATAAVELFIDCINLKAICRHCISQQTQRPVIFIGPYEHHSNLIPWRETGCEIVMIPESPITQTVDMDVLEESLQRPNYRHNCMKLGTFTAASNVTGKICHVNRIAAMLHKYHAMAIFDYATASSYTKIDMNPTTVQYDDDDDTTTTAEIAKDAIFISPHKMIGGSTGTPGILIIKKQWVNQVQAPNRSGGGTVFYVTHDHHRFLSNRIHRYEGGTANIVGIIRTGLTFLLKRQLDDQYRSILQLSNNNNQVLKQSSSSCQHPSVSTPNTIEEYDISTYHRVARLLKDQAPNLILLGYDDQNKNNINDNLPIFSFLIRFGQRFLHYNYVCALLNDIFGIQSRGGCQCAGPYSQKLLGLVTPSDENGGDVPNVRNVEIEDALYRYKERAELLRPGYTRLSLPFKGLRAVEVDYVCKALVWISHHGWEIMCQYRCNHRTGEWRHANRQGKPLGRHERKWLSHYTMQSGTINPIPSGCNVFRGSTCSKILDETFENAERIRMAARSDQRSIVEASKMMETDLMFGNDDSDDKIEKLRWYVYPKECADLLVKGVEQSPHSSDQTSILLGAINPIAMSSASMCDENMGCRKRKSSVESVHALSDPLDVAAATRTNVGDTKSGTLLPSVIGSTNLQVPANHTEVIHQDGIEGLENRGLQKKGPRTSADWGTRFDIPQGMHLSIKTGGEISTATESMSQTCSQASPLTSATSVSKKQKFRHVKPPPKLMRTATQAIVQWDMIKDGDRLLLGLSGGKDSLSLLHLLLEFKRVRPIKFDLEVCTIDPMTPSFDPSPLIPYVESLGLTYHYIRDDIVSRANNSGTSGKIVSSLCAFCARMKRGNLYSCARRNNCNKLVLAQHLDDCAESMMMSMMHNGFLRTMKANYAIDAGDLFVIRPLIYCREGLMTSFAKDANLPVINENCPACFEEPKERARIKKMLSREETLYPNFYDNIRRSLIPLMHDDMAAILRAFTEETVARSRKIPWKDRIESHTSSSDTAPKVSAKSRQLFSLVDVPDDELVRELARRKAAKCMTTAVAIDKTENSIPDGTGQVCTLNGGDGSIPCCELME